MPPKFPCPECGAKKGRAHETWCSHAQVRRRSGFGKLPKDQQAKYEKKKRKNA